MGNVLHRSEPIVVHIHKGILFPLYFNYYQIGRCTIHFVSERKLSVVIPRVWNEALRWGRSSTHICTKTKEEYPLLTNNIDILV